MSLAARWSRLDRVQRSLPFRIAATVLVVALALGGIGWVVLDAASDPGGVREALRTAIEAAEQADSEMASQFRTAEDILNAARSPVSLSMGIAALAGVILLFVWMGLGLTYLFLTVGVGLLAVPLLAFPGTRAFGFVAIGGGQLLLSFAVLLRAATVLLSPAVPVLAIARNVLAEAVRMRLSLLFIAMLIAILAFMPMILDADQPLRFRVQAFLQYANMLTFGIVALLVLFFGVATVAFEQRDKIIWQTMTKPVPAWQYVLGKWLGVVTLAAVLLLVASTGVFVFTEGLRRTPAMGEIRAYEPADESLAVTEDRLILETRVLTARRSVFPSLPFDAGDPMIDEMVEARVEELRRQGGYEASASDRRRFRIEALQQAGAAYRSIDPNTEGDEQYIFEGLGEAKARGLPLTLQYRVEAEGNRPDIFYNITFRMDDGTIVGPRRTGLGFAHTLTIAPDFIDDAGVLRFRMFNGAVVQLPDGSFEATPNINSIVIPPDGLEVSYEVGSFRGNFLRVQAVQWIKLCFLAMVAVCSATFLSFPVACLISVGVFFLAQSSGWVQGALPGYGTTTLDGDHDPFRWFIYHFSDYVSRAFKVYDDLKPTQRLSDGRLLSWGSVAKGIGFLGFVSGVIFALGVSAFRKRQLAIYSGH